MTNILSGIIALVIAMVSCTGCVGQADAARVTPDTAAPSPDIVPVPIGNEPSVFEGKLASVLADKTDITKNTVYSPFSLFAVLAMLREGADGETLDEIDAVLGNSGDAIAEDAYATLSHLLTLEDTVLQITNSVWVDEKFAPKQEYLEALARYYMAECYTADLPRAESRVNSYIEEHTKGLIKNMLSDTALDSAVMALINTLYLDADWRSSFKAESTHKRTFVNADGTKKDVEFMYNSERYENVIDTDNCIGVAMPYKDGALTFVAVMPKDETMSAASLTELVCTESSFAQLAAGAVGETARLYIPKFEIEYSLDLTDTLKAMGITSAFSDLADLSRIADDIKLDTVLQKAVIKVDEKGTEAAAVTIGMIACTSAAPAEDPRVIEFNRPFSFAVVDSVTGVVLFCGEHNVAG